MNLANIQNYTIDSAIAILILSFAYALYKITCRCRMVRDQRNPDRNRMVIEINETNIPLPYLSSPQNSEN